LSNRGGFYHPAVYVEEARRLGIEVRPPDVNRSKYGYTVEGDAVRVGFVEVRNLTQTTIEAVLESRKEGPFGGLGELCRRTGMPYADAQVLVEAGACDGFGRSRPELLWELKLLFREGRAGVRRDEELFPDQGTPGILPQIPDYSRKKRADLEWTALGLTTLTHPIAYYLALLTDRMLVLSNDLPAYAGRTVTMVGWLIADRRVGLKGRGAMKFLTFEDPAGVFEAVLFPTVYQACGHLLDSHGPYFVSGQVQEEDHYCSLIVDALERVGHSRKSRGMSEITPPKRWLFQDSVTQAD
jgi:DNA polymerase III alpha subunit